MNQSQSDPTVQNEFAFLAGLDAAAGAESADANSPDPGEFDFAHWLAHPPVLPPGPFRSRPGPSPEQAKADAAVRAFALEQPLVGQVKAAKILTERGFPVKQGRIQYIWVEAALSSVRERAAAAEEHARRTGSALTPEQKAALARARELADEDGSSALYPGHTVALDVLPAGALADGTLVFLQTALDAHSRVAFVRAYPEMDLDAQARFGSLLIYTRVVPFLHARGLTISRILTDQAPCYRAKYAARGGRKVNEFQEWARRFHFTHITTRRADKAALPVCRSLHEALLRDLPRPAPASIPALQTVLDAWTASYNASPLSVGIGPARSPLERLADGAGLAPPPDAVSLAVAAEAVAQIAVWDASTALEGAKRAAARPPDASAAPSLAAAYEQAQAAHAAAVTALAAAREGLASAQAGAAPDRPAHGKN